MHPGVRALPSELRGAPKASGSISLVPIAGMNVQVGECVAGLVLRPLAR
jgi:hypothetical protein